MTVDNTTYTSPASGKSYDFNAADKMNELLTKSLLTTGGLRSGQEHDFDFDHQFIQTEKFDAKRTCKKFYRTAINGIEFEPNSMVVEKWEGKPYRLVVQRQRRTDNMQEIWEGEYTYRCIFTNDFKSGIRDIVEFYNLRGRKERIFDEMNNGFG